MVCNAFQMRCGSNPCLHSQLQSCQPRSHASAIFSMQGMGRAAHIGNINLPTSAHNAEGLTLALYVADRPTEVQKHLWGTVQQEVTNTLVKSRGPHEPATVTNTSGEGVYTPGHIRSWSMDQCWLSALKYLTWVSYCPGMINLRITVKFPTSS